MCHLRHSLRICLFRRKVIFHSQDIQVLVFLTIPWFTKFVMSWWVFIHETGCIFEYLFWTTTHLSHQTWPIDRSVFAWKKQCVFCSSYVLQNLCMRCLNFEFDTYVIKCIFIFVSVNKVTTWWSWTSAIKLCCCAY